MYFFLACLSFMDVTYSSCIIPRLRSDFFFGENIISFEYCMIQLFIQHISGGSEVFLLLAMAYDCYVTICMLLHYLVIMRQRMCSVLLVLSCTGGFMHSFNSFYYSTIYRLPFCGPERLLLNDKTLGFLASGGDKFNPGPETRLDRSELEVLLKYKGDRESFWHRHQKGTEKVPPC